MSLMLRVIAVFVISSIVVPVAGKDDIAIWANSGSTPPGYALWDGNSFSSSMSMQSTRTRWKLIRGAYSPTRNEAIVLGLTYGQEVTAQIYNGKSWSNLPFSPIDYKGKSFYQSAFDVRYESKSGDALLVWIEGETDIISYRKWNGVSWSSETRINVPSMGQTHYQLDLVPSPLSNEMMLIVVGDAKSDDVLVWDGNSFGRKFEIKNNVNYGLIKVKVVYEQQSGRAIMVYPKKSHTLHYRVWNGSWSGEGTITPPSGISSSYDINYICAASDPSSNRIVVGASTYTKFASWFVIWDGRSGWGSKVNAASSSSARIIRTIDVAFESNSGQALAVYTRGSDKVLYRTFSSSWSSERSGPDVGDQPNSMRLFSSPSDDEIMIAIQDNSQDANFCLWEGSDWGRVYRMTSNTGETPNRGQPYLFLWNQKEDAPPTLPPSPPPSPPPTPMRPTPSPTSSPTAKPTVCVDDPGGWYDPDGEIYNCAWYGLDDNCKEYGDLFENFGVTANEACCSCQGGKLLSIDEITPTPTPLPTVTPTKMPTTKPTDEPTPLPTSSPSLKPTPLFTEFPTTPPTPIPTVPPTPPPSPSPTPQPTPGPTPTPSPPPSLSPTPSPPTPAPSPQLTLSPTPLPTNKPTLIPTERPTAPPSPLPTRDPTNPPTLVPTSKLTHLPTIEPSISPSKRPATSPPTQQTGRPTKVSTETPTLVPTARPTAAPTMSPTLEPSKSPTIMPTRKPTLVPSVSQTPKPTTEPIRTPPQDTPSPVASDVGVSFATRSLGIGRACSIDKDCKSNACRRGVCMASSDCYPIKHKHGAQFTKHHVNIVFVASAFDGGSHEEWNNQVNKTYTLFKSYNMFSESIDELSFFRVDPEKLDASFCMRGCAGIDRLLCCDVERAHRLSSKCSPVGSNMQTVIIHNSNAYGGAGYTISNVATTSVHPNAPLVAVHELGHSLFKLNDEYTYGPATDDDPNCDSTRKCNKWKDLRKNTPAPYEPAKCLPGCRNGNFFVGSKSFMDVLNLPVGAVNERFTCCTYQMLTKSFPFYCDVFDFSPGYLLNYCKERDYQNYGSANYEVDPLLAIPANAKEANNNAKATHVYVSDPVLVTIMPKIRRNGRTVFKVKQARLPPGTFPRAQVQGEFSKPKAAAKEGIDSLVKVVVLYKEGKEILLFSRNVTIDVPLPDPYETTQQDDEAIFVSQQSDVVEVVLNKKGRIVSSVRALMVAL